MIERSFPIIGSRDLAQLVAFYRDLFGGQVSYQFPATGDPEYVTVRLGSSSLGIAQDPTAPTGGARGFELCVYVSNVDATVVALRAAGVRVLDEPATQPWGERMARVADTDGNRIALFAESPRS